MKCRALILFLIFPFFYFSTLYGLNRDYDVFGHPHCPEHLTECQLDCADLTPDLAQFFPATKERCILYKDNKNKQFYCQNGAIYYGYVDFDFCKYRIHLKRHLQYCQKNPTCNCFWPEYSYEAAQISDYAYLLFRDLILNTALLELGKNFEEQEKFTQMDSSSHGLNVHGLTIFLIAKQLHFVDYYNVCRDVENYAGSRYSERDAAEIKDKLEDILEVLYSKFYGLNQVCIAKHPSLEIAQEIQLMNLLANVDSIKRTSKNSYDASYSFFDKADFTVGQLSTINFPIEKTHKKCKKFDSSVSEYKFLNQMKADELPFSIELDIFLEQGTLFNNLSLYDDAIVFLNLAIQKNPSCRDAYIERAYAYFETNRLPLALKDYESAKRLTIIPGMQMDVLFMAGAYIPANKSKFSQGLIVGTLKGAKTATVEFIPSIFSCCTGILNGLWAFACSPAEVSHEVINTSYAIGEYISTHSSLECLEYVVPELRELSLTWDQLEDYSRGEKIGYIIGKYGVDIFAPLGAVKGVKKLRSLKRANTMATLECCIASQVKQVKVLEESAKFASVKTAYCELAKNGRIVTKCSNSQVHIMQKKHAWDKLITLSGAVEEDFAKVAFLLEEHNVIDKSYVIGNPKFYPKEAPKISKVIYEKNINGFIVHVQVETYLDTGTSFLQDAWVVTK